LLENKEAKWPIFAVFIPHNQQVEPISQAALAAGRVTSELSAALNDKKNQIYHHVEESIILIVTALMVLKPF
jgi:hypothetical protein